MSYLRSPLRDWVAQVDETPVAIHRLLIGFFGIDIHISASSAFKTGSLPLSCVASLTTLSVEQQTWQSYLDQIEFFVKSPLLLSQAVLAGMRERGFGRIIQIGSEVVEVGNPCFANYVAAKAAQLGQTRSWARELGPAGITVNLVAPGWIPTERVTDASVADLQAYIDGVLMRRVGLPEEVGRVVAFLASDAAAFVNGQKIAVNGGNTLG
jgi:3-oxoacyl-[acyl-carrier protein] reductase